MKAFRFFEEWIRSFLFTALPVLAGLFFAGCGTSIDTPFGRSPTDSVDFGNPPGNGGGASQPKPPADAPRQTRYCFLEPDGEYTRSVSMQQVHERVQRTPARFLLDMVEERDDAETADVIIQTVFFEDIIFG